MPPARVVDAVTLGTLQEPADPPGRPDVPVIEEFGQSGQQHDAGDDRGFETQQEIEQRAGQETVENQFHRVLVEGGQNLQS